MLKRRDFLKIPALLAIPVIGIPKAKSGTVEVKYEDTISWDDKHVYVNGHKMGNVKVNIREAHRTALAEWLTKEMDKQMFKALTNG
jgi:hypothetical protein